MRSSKLIFFATLGLFSVLALPLHAEAPAAAATPPAPAVDAKKEMDDGRMTKMRDRWKKMTPDQKDEMRKKAERRLQERYDRLTAEQKAKINGIVGDLDKLTKEEKSVLMAKVRQKAHKEGVQRKMMKEMEMGKATDSAAKPAVVTPVVATPPAAPEAPTAPVAPVAAPAPAAAPTPAAPPAPATTH